MVEVCILILHGTFWTFSRLWLGIAMESCMDFRQDFPTSTPYKLPRKLHLTITQLFHCPRFHCSASLLVACRFKKYSMLWSGCNSAACWNNSSSKSMLHFQKNKINNDSFQKKKKSFNLKQKKAATIDRRAFQSSVFVEGTKSGRIVISRSNLLLRSQHYALATAKGRACQKNLLNERIKRMTGKSIFFICSF